MIVEDVSKVFKNYIIGNELKLPDGSTVEVEFFANVLFPTASANPTYNELVAIDEGTKGYISFFDLCKAEGSILI